MRVFIIFLTLVSFQSRASFNVLHYNIKELDSSDLIQNNQQLESVRQVIKPFDPDIVSFNEIQFDLKDVPNKSYQTVGTNLSKLRHILGLKELTEQSFHPANTGLLAKQKADGSYFTNANTSLARAHADQVNFGVFPAQYSTGGFFKYKKIDEIIITDLKWKAFNPNADFSPYKLGNGDSIPDDIQLFDKNFSDITLEIEGKPVHIILLHTVPSYHFGNKFSINDFRNAEQLRFLNWYLTGKTDRSVDLKNIKPLKPDAYFVAMGDFNVSLFDEESEGSDVLKDLFARTNLWTQLKPQGFTNESSNFAPNPMRLLLDYIITSKNIRTLRGEVVLPRSFKRVELGCNQKKMNTRSYRNRDGETCHVQLDLEYDHFKQASDHYPLYGEFELR